MKSANLYIEKICSDCLQEIVNDEHREDEDFSKRMVKTLNKWALEGYAPSGLTEDTESQFSYRHCPLCGDLAGDRYEYYFTVEQK